MKRILYIEDNPVTQKLMHRHLKALAAITVAATFKEGQLLLRDQTFDLVLADVNLPDGNALDLVRELRARYSPSQLPVILVSAAMDQLLKVQSLQAGANECFPMPTPWPILLGTVQRMLDCPYVRPNDFGAVAVTWIEGTAGDHFWVYCPELNLRLDGQDQGALREAMAEQVRNSARDNSRLEYVNQVKVTARLVEIAHR